LLKYPRLVLQRNGYAIHHLSACRDELLFHQLHIDLGSHTLALAIESRDARCDEHVSLAPLITTAWTCIIVHL